MQLSKVTSWGLILGGLLGILGFMAFALALGLMDEDIAPADELKAFQDNQLLCGRNGNAVCWNIYIHGKVFAAGGAGSESSR
ncbi:MAG: hypothetical protein CM1200mP39_26320 [Dehalococcoidia bacterium]|nr:MAG: hypothetical protein CM1200mP39_26320 [Dehalococcoidia bacterium]